MNDEQARLRNGRVQPFASAVRGCSLISTVFGSKKSGGGGREIGREEEGRVGGSSRQSVSYRQSGGREREARGAEGCSVTAWEM